MDAWHRFASFLTGRSIYETPVRPPSGLQGGTGCEDSCDEAPFLSPSKALREISGDAGLFGQAIRFWAELRMPEWSTSVDEAARRLDETGWPVAIAQEFRKTLPAKDRTMLGQVLVATIEICVDPMRLSGRAVSPLEGDRGGLWRYRAANWTLIYRPDRRLNTLTLLSFEPAPAG